MATLEAFPDGEWDFSRIFSTEDQLDFTSELLGQFSFSLENDEDLRFTNSSSSLAFPPNPEAKFNESMFYSLNTLNPDFHLISHQEINSSSNSSSSNVLTPFSCYETTLFSNSNHIPPANDISMPMDFFIMDEKNSNSFAAMFPDIVMPEMENLDNSQPEVNDAVPPKDLQLKRKFDVSESEVNPSKKKTRITRDVQNSKKNVRSKKNQKCNPNCNAEDERNVGPDGQSTSSCSSEEDNATQDSNDSKVSEALNCNGKTRASRGSATDPQSLYARKRRERINERLRILQNLVPNGTKVDISTMLEEAVHYVKFLQLQIKLLSSDNLWMYAPIAYNGMDIGLNQKISMLL